MSSSGKHLSIDRPLALRAFAALDARRAPLVGRNARWLYHPASDDDLYCSIAEMARHDARLLGAPVELFLERWVSIAPTLLRAAIRRMRWPQAMCVVVEFTREAGHDHELTLWARHVCADWRPVDPAEHFFVDDVRPGERLATRWIGRSRAAYSRWGFLAVERPTIDPHRNVRVGRSDARTRRPILDTLVSSPAQSVTLADYLDAIDGSISRQQALADLHRAGLAPTRPGPGATWRARRARRKRAP